MHVAYHTAQQESQSTRTTKLGGCSGTTIKLSRYNSKFLDGGLTCTPPDWAPKDHKKCKDLTFLVSPLQRALEPECRILIVYYTIPCTTLNTIPYYTMLYYTIGIPYYTTRLFGGLTKSSPDVCKQRPAPGFATALTEAASLRKEAAAKAGLMQRLHSKALPPG